MSDVEKLENYREDPVPDVTAIKTMLLTIRTMVERSDLANSDQYVELLDAIDISRAICNRHELLLKRSENES